MVPTDAGTSGSVEHASEHFVVRYQPGWLAEVAVATIVARAEAFLARCSEWLAKATPQPHYPITITVTGTAPPPSGRLDQPQAPPPAGAPAAIHLRADPEGMVSGLEEWIFTLLVRERAPAASPTAPVVQAAVRLLLSQQPGRPDSNMDLDRVAYQSGVTEDGAPNLLGERGQQARGLGALADASFLSFLESAYGPQKVPQFLCDALNRGVDAAAQVSFGRGLQELRRSWVIALKAKCRPRVALAPLLRRAGTALRPHWSLVARYACLSILAVAAALTMPGLTGQYLFDKILRPPNGAEPQFKLMWVWVPAVVLTFAASSLAEYFRSLALVRLELEIGARIQSKAFAHLQTLSMRYFHRRNTGDLLTRITQDCRGVATQFAQVIPTGLVACLQFLAAAGYMLYLSPWLGCVVLAIGAPLYWYIFAGTSRRSQDASRELQARYSGFASLVDENVSAQYLVKTLDLGSYAQSGFQRELASLNQAMTRLRKAGAQLSSGCSMVQVGVYATTMAIGALLIQDKVIEIGSLITVVGLIPLVLRAISDLAQNGQTLQSNVGSIERVDEFMATKPDIKEAKGASQLGPVRQGMKLDNVTMGYDEGTPILHDLTLEIPAGQRVAVVGPSGAGKSTLLSLLLRLVDPGQGRVLFDGVDLRDVTLESVHRQVAVVPQDTFIFNATVYENIALGLEGATEESVMAAARDAALDETIKCAEGGYQASAGERGGRFSGGQRQRFSIARVLMRAPSVLLLDEATSALDPATETEIMQTLREVGKGRTTVTVTHRLTSITDYDRIIVLDQGRMVEQGTHDELIARDGLYRRLFDEQMGRLRAGARGRVGPEQAGLSRIPLFAGLPAEALDAIADCLSAESYEPGANIVSQGEPADKFYIISDGQVETVADTGAGLRRLSLLNEGEYFGEIALLADVPRTATVRAVVPSRVLGLGRAEFLALVQAQPRIGETLRQAMQRRLEVFPPKTAPPAVP